MENQEFIEEQIRAYRENDLAHSSPLWIWFAKVAADMVTCLVCQQTVTSTNYGTTNMKSHLKRHHGEQRKYNAWIIYEELAELKELRIGNRKSQPSQKVNKYGTKNVVAVAKKRTSALMKRKSSPVKRRRRSKEEVDEQLFGDPQDCHLFNGMPDDDEEEESLGEICIYVHIHRLALMHWDLGAPRGGVYKNSDSNSHLSLTFLFLSFYLLNSMLFSSQYSELFCYFFSVHIL